VVSSTPRPHFTPRKDPVPIVQEAGWAPGPVWTGGKSCPHRNSIPDRSSVAIPTELPGPHVYVLIGQQCKTRRLIWVPAQKNKRMVIVIDLCTAVLNKASCR